MARTRLEIAADKLLHANGWVETVPDDILCGNPNDLDAILHGPSWLSEMVSRKMGVTVR